MYPSSVSHNTALSFQLSLMSSAATNCPWRSSVNDGCFRSLVQLLTRVDNACSDIGRQRLFRGCIAISRSSASASGHSLLGYKLWFCCLSRKSTERKR